MIDINDVGKYYTTNGGDVWIFDYGCQTPTAHFRNLVTGEEVGGSIYSPICEPFIKLIPEGERK